MLTYILKRLLYFIPTFLVISLIVFFLSKAAGEFLNCELDPKGPDPEICRAEAHLKGYDLPVFYFSVTTAAYPDTLYKVFRPERRAVLQELVGQHGNWTRINDYYQQLRALEDMISRDDRVEEQLTRAGKTVQQLLIKSRPEAIKSLLNQLTDIAKNRAIDAEIGQRITQLNGAYRQMVEEATPHLHWLPALHWYGLNNQYHRWLSRFLMGDFGVSVRDQRPVRDKIADRLPWTLYLTLPSILLAYLLSIPIGVYSATRPNSQRTVLLDRFLLFLYSLPTFWIGTLLVVFFTTPEYGLKLFPSVDTPGTHLTAANAPKLILPIFCLTYGTLAFMSRQVRSSMREALQQDYIRTARAKGLSESVVVWRHAFPNALFPLITIFGAVLPAAFGGSVVIESIFNINGIGWLMLNSITARDWPVVYAILMIAAVLTMVGLLIADLLYIVADPRVRLGEKQP